MSVTITPIAGTVRLEVTGSNQTTLTVPYEDDDRLFVRLSDGTLLIGTYDESLRCVWAIAKGDASNVLFSKGRVILEGHMEWIAASALRSKYNETAEPPGAAAVS